MSSRERALTIFFAALFFVNAGYLVLGFASVPLYYERVTTLTVEPYQVGDQALISNELAQSEADKRGLSLAQYAIEQIFFGSAIVLLSVVVAGLIVYRARWNWFAWYSAFFMVFISEYALSNPIFVARLVPPWLVEVSSLAWPLVLLYFFLFPNGKPVPRRVLWLLVPFVVLHFFLQAIGLFLAIAPTSELAPFFDQAGALFELVIPVEIILVFICQGYRYWRVSSAQERQQTKWFLFGLGVFVATLPLDSLIASSPYADEINVLFFAFVPLTVGIAILRYRLWDIDVLIRRTLTYALVAALLAIVYFGSVIVLQQVFAAVSGQRSEVITVLSTLTIAALFVPLRNRIQNLIDQRFNRKKYDAQKVLEQFSTTVRDETDLEKLSGSLIGVVNETMQPRSVSLWLKRIDDRLTR